MTVRQYATMMWLDLRIAWQRFLMRRAEARLAKAKEENERLGQLLNRLKE